MPTFHIGLLVFDGCQESGITTPVDVFRIANTMPARRPDGPMPSFETVLVSVDGGARRTAEGFRIETVSADIDVLDALIVPGITHKDAAEIKTALSWLDAEAALVARFAEAKKPVLAACSGVFILAASGALDTRQATTSWWLAAALGRLFPRIRLATDHRQIDDGPCVSAAGVTSFYDLALWLVDRFGGEALGRDCAKFLLLNRDRQSQTPFVIGQLGDKTGADPMERARAWLNQNLASTVRIDDLARHCGVSPRTLLRQFRHATGGTPVRYVQTLRLERAKALLEDSALPVDEIIVRCGYQDVSTFRKTFKQRVQLTPQQYRDRFRPRQAPETSPPLTARAGAPA